MKKLIVIWAMVLAMLLLSSVTADAAAGREYGPEDNSYSIIAPKADYYAESLFPTLYQSNG